MDLKSQILTATDTKREKVDAPEWTAEPLYIHEMGGHDRVRWYEQAYPNGKADNGTYHATLLAYTLHDSEGKRIFDPSTPADIEALSDKNPTVLKRLFDLAMRVNGMGKEAEETTAKNS